MGYSASGSVLYPFFAMLAAINLNAIRTERVSLPQMKMDCQTSDWTHWTGVTHIAPFNKTGCYTAAQQHIFASISSWSDTISRVATKIDRCSSRTRSLYMSGINTLANQRKARHTATSLLP